MILSIVIPTKDRYKYLIQLVKLIDSYNLEETEIVIEDNSDDNSIWVDFTNSSKIKVPIRYNHIKGQISVRKNSENGIFHSTGEYVCTIGDDDAVMPNIEECANWMRDNNIDSLRQKTEITYKWPAYNDEFNKKIVGGYLSYDPSKSITEIVDSKRAVIDVIKSGFSSLGHCPCYYHGIVARKTLDKLYGIGGSFIPGPSPDMANAVALSFVADKFCITDIPFVISGGSEYQGGKSSKVRSWVLPLSQVPFISDEDKSKWDKRLPYIWAAPTVWPESGLKGLEYVGRKDLERYVDFNDLIARILLQVNGDDFRMVINKSSNKRDTLTKYYKKKIRFSLSKIKGKLVEAGYLPNKSTRQKTNNLVSISEAIDYLSMSNNCHFTGIKI